MSNTIVYVFLNLIGFSLLVLWLKNTISDYIHREPSLPFFTWKRFRYFILTILITGIPLALANFTPLFQWLHVDISDNGPFSLFGFAVLVSFFISLIWFIYLVKLDIYEPEKWKHLLLVFVLSILSTISCTFIYPIIHALGFNHSPDPIQDFIYCVFGIGLVEETVKFIPFLIIWKFTKAVNEPYDYLLYASVSALGFAFTENALYLNNYGIEIIGARAFYASVAHMTFCSTVTYGLLLKQFRYKKWPTGLVFLIFFGIAIFSHGFYDFWLINKAVSQYQGITLLFFLITIHIWFTMKNNAINISNFFDQSVKLNNDKLKHFLVVGLLSIFMLSYVYTALIWDIKDANKYFVQSIAIYGYVIFYLIASFSRFHIVQGYIKPLQLPFDFIVPKLGKKK